MDPMNDLFDELTPPPGGLDRLRSRLANERRRRAARWAAGGAVVLAAVALFWMRPVPEPVLVFQVDPAAISVPRDARARVVVSLVSESDAVVFYDVASTVQMATPEL